MSKGKQLQYQWSCWVFAQNCQVIPPQQENLKSVTVIPISILRIGPLWCRPNYCVGGDLDLPISNGDTVVFKNSATILLSHLSTVSRTLTIPAIYNTFTEVSQCVTSWYFACSLSAPKFKVAIQVSVLSLHKINSWSCCSGILNTKSPLRVFWTESWAHVDSIENSMSTIVTCSIFSWFQASVRSVMRTSLACMYAGAYATLCTHSSRSSELELAACTIVKKSVRVYSHMLRVITPWPATGFSGSTESLVSCACFSMRKFTKFCYKPT